MPVKRYDLIQSINSRGTFVVSQACIPHLKAAGAGHILTLSPPINMNPRWLGAHAPYTLSKYGMSLLTLGMAAELDGTGVAANCLWPETTIATAAVQNLLGGDEMIQRSRTPEIVADAAYEILAKDPATTSGECFIDSEVLTAAGGYDLESYAVQPGLDLYPDVFLDV
jgi:citronellol/citronellal dehydrogenase